MLGNSGITEKALAELEVGDRIRGKGGNVYIVIPEQRGFKMCKNMRNSKRAILRAGVLYEVLLSPDEDTENA